MTDPARRGGAVTRWRMLVLIAAAAALLAGCELATGTVRTVTELRDAGIRNPNLQYDNGVATLEYDADPNPLEARAEQDRAAEVIWRNLPFRIDQITIASGGGDFRARNDYPRALLEREFGPRPAGLDRSPSDVVRRAVLIASVVAVLVLVAVVLIIVLVVRAVRRRPAPPPGGAWPQGGGQQQPWGQPPWGQVGPPAQPAPPGQQPWGQPGPSPPSGQGWPPPQQQPPPPPVPPPGPGGDRPAGASRPQGGEQPPAPAPPRGEPPARGPGDTQRLEPDPPPGHDQGPVPPA
jgi:hypothetical protein